MGIKNIYKMTKANIRAYFIKDYYETSLNFQFKINGFSYKTSDKFANIELKFNELESEIGKKVCRYEIKEKNLKLNCKGLVEIYPGFSNAYIFLNNQGIAFEFIFLKELMKLKLS